MKLGIVAGAFGAALAAVLDQLWLMSPVQVARPRIAAATPAVNGTRVPFASPIFIALPVIDRMRSSAAEP